MITLCEKCFPDEKGEHEVHTIVPISPCAVCGSLDDRYRGGTPAHLYPRDPRPLTNPLTQLRQQQERERFDLWARTEWDPEDFQDPHHSIAMDAAWKAWWARANQPGVHLLV